MGYYITVEEFSQLRRSMKDLCKIFAQAHFVCHWYINTHHLNIVNEIHWHSAVTKHSRIEIVWRYVLKTAYIIFGRDL